MMPDHCYYVPPYVLCMTMRISLTATADKGWWHDGDSGKDKGRFAPSFGRGDVASFQMSSAVPPKALEGWFSTSAAS